MPWSKPLFLGFVLIAGYLAVNYYTGFGQSVGALTQATTSTVKAFQGR
jgi:hypothetical protein